ncbi:MAG: WS/DGAT domain-containing protein [Microthrixaceae bacterium]
MPRSRTLGAAHGWITGSWAGATDALGEAAHRAGSAVASSGPLVDAFSGALGDVDVARKLLLGTRNDATVWTGHAGAQGGRVVRASDLDRVKALRAFRGCTVNDVLVSCVAGTLRHYLRSHGEHCASVAVMVPVNLTPMDLTLPEDLGNSFALVQLELPTEDPDPVSVLHTVHHRMQRIKHGHEAAVAFRIQETIAGLGRSIYEVSVDLLANRTVGVLTNVPGPPMPVYLAGSRIEGMTGWAPLSGDQPLSFTIYSYDGRVTIGIACDHGLVPDHEMIVDGFARAFSGSRTRRADELIRRSPSSP